VAWTTPTPSDSIVEWSDGEPQGILHTEAKTTSHVVRITGLEPATEYRYCVRSGSARSAMHTFRTVPAETAPFVLAFGGDGTSPQSILEREPAFVCHAGTPPAALRGCLTALAPEDGTWRSFTWLNAEVFVLDAASLRPNDAQSHWIQTQLAQSKANWKIVLCRPSPLDDRVRATLLPLLLGHADLVLAEAESPLHIDTIGQGAKPEENAVTLVTTSPEEQGFLVALVDAESIILQVMSGDGTAASKTTLRKERDERVIGPARPVDLLEVAPAFQPTAGFDMGAIGKDLVSKDFSVKLANPYAAPIEGELRWIVHTNTSWTLDPPLLKIAVPPRSKKTYTFTAGIVAPDIDPAPTFTFTCGKHHVETDASPFRFTKADVGR